MLLKIVIFIVIGLVGGLIGGMGMGGGTLLIPLLTLFTGLEQHVAQAINLIAFVPMSVAAIVIHAKNQLIEYKYVIWIAIPAVVFSVGSSLLAKVIGGKALGRYFGIFLVLLGIYQLIGIIVIWVKSHRQKKAEQQRAEEAKKAYRRTTEL